MNVTRVGTNPTHITQQLKYQEILKILNSNPNEASKYLNSKPSIFDNNQELKSSYDILPPDKQDMLKKAIF